MRGVGERPVGVEHIEPVGDALAAKLLDDRRAAPLNRLLIAGVDGSTECLVLGCDPDLHGTVQHDVDEQPGDRGESGRDQERRLEADAVGEDASDGQPADGRDEHPAHEHRHALGTVARVGVVATQAWAAMKMSP